MTKDLTLTAQWERIHTSAPSAPRYDVAVSDGAHGSVTASPARAAAGATVTLTVTPTGCTLETLTVTDKNGNALDLTDQGNGKYTFRMPSGPVTVTATFMDDNTMLNFFVDVPAGAWMFLLPFTDVPEWAYESVAWCCMNGVTEGVSETAFAPDGSCTRAQAAAMLYRMMTQE